MFYLEKHLHSYGLLSRSLSSVDQLVASIGVTSWHCSRNSDQVLWLNYQTTRFSQILHQQQPPRILAPVSGWTSRSSQLSSIAMITTRTYPLGESDSLVFFSLGVGGETSWRWRHPFSQERNRMHSCLMWMLKKTAQFYTPSWERRTHQSHKKAKRFTPHCRQQSQWEH